MKRSAHSPSRGETPRTWLASGFGDETGDRGWGSKISGVGAMDTKPLIGEVGYKSDIYVGYILIGMTEGTVVRTYPTLLPTCSSIRSYRWF